MNRASNFPTNKIEVSKEVQQIVAALYPNESPITEIRWRSEPLEPRPADFSCHVCHKPITDANAANAQWYKGQYLRADAKYVHKGDCSNSTEETMPAWKTLSDYLEEIDGPDAAALEAERGEIERVLAELEETETPIHDYNPAQRKPFIVDAKGLSLEQLEAGENDGDASASDYQYVCLLAEQGLTDGAIDARFRASKRMREKWDDRHRGDGATYGEITIERARKNQATKKANEPAVMEEYVSPVLPSNEVPRFEAERVDYVDQLAEELTAGTMLPFNFARETLKMLLLAGLPQTPELAFNKQVHNRQYVILLSETAGSGKGETWRRAWATLFKTPGFMEQFKYREIMGSRLGSPESAVLEFGGQIEGKPKDKEKAPLILTSNIMRNVVHYDEGKKMLVKDASGTHGRGLVSMFTTLYESNRDGFGSIKNGRAQVNNANVSLMMHFVRESFDQAFAGTEAGSDGFLSRCTLIADHKNTVAGDWRVVDSRRVQELMDRLADCMGRSEVMLTPEANAERLAAVAVIRSWDVRLAARLEAHFCQDIMARAIFGTMEQTREAEGAYSEPARVSVADVGVVRRAFAWTQHQYEARQVIWPQDAATDKYERMGRLLDAAVERHGPMTRTLLSKAVNLKRLGSGGWVVFDRALKSSDLTIVGQTRQGRPIYGKVE